MQTQPQQKRNSIWIVPVLAVLAGTGVGAASAIVHYQRPSMQLPGHEAKKRSEPGVPAATLKARAILPHGDEHDFGMMSRGETKSHSFQVRNIGNGPLTLRVLDTTCKCTVGELEKDTIPSGETVDVTLTWEAKSYDREFRQSATIETNDPATREIVLSVYGKVTQLAMPEVPVVQFNRVSRSEPKTFRTPIYGYRDEDLLITSHEFFDEETAEFFDVKIEPLPKDKWTDAEAKSGLLCTVNIKPGLPIGGVKQGIRLQTNKKDIPPIELAIDMNVVSDISVIGPNFRTEKNLLIWGSAAKGEVDNRKKLFLIVKGRYQSEVDFSLAKADPDGVLTAEFGEPVDVKRNIDGKETVIARRFPMDVIIKKGASGLQRMGNVQSPLGELTLNTKHPEIDEFTVYVKFTVE